MTTKQLMRGIKRAMEQDQQPAAKRRKTANKRAANQLITTNLPIVPRSYSTARAGGSTYIVKNTEVLFAAAGAATTPYSVVTVTYASPRVFSWARNLALAFGKYRFKSLKFHFKPTVGTDQSGYFAMGFFTDPEDGTNWQTGVSASAALTQLSQTRKFVQGPLYHETSITLDRSDFTSDWYYVDQTVADTSDSRLSNSGSLGAITAANASLGTSTAGVVYVEYEVEFADPTAYSHNT